MKNNTRCARNFTEADSAQIWPATYVVHERMKGINSKDFAKFAAEKAGYLCDIVGAGAREKVLPEKIDSRLRGNDDGIVMPAGTNHPVQAGIQQE